MLYYGWGTLTRVTYELVCNLCPRDDDSNVVVPEGDGRSAVYRGQTAHTLHKRLREHIGEVRRGSSTNGMAKHIMASHPDADRATGSQLLFTGRIIGHKRLNMERGVLEALQIEEVEENPRIEVCNSKAEWGRASLRRLTVADG